MVHPLRNTRRPDDARNLRESCVRKVSHDAVESRGNQPKADHAMTEASPDGRIAHGRGCLYDMRVQVRTDRAGEVWHIWEQTGQIRTDARGGLLGQLNSGSLCCASAGCRCRAAGHAGAFGSQSTRNGCGCTRTRQGRGREGGRIKHPRPASQGRCAQVPTDSKTR